MTEENEILFTFSIEELGKNYIVYTINDDNKKDNIEIAINEFKVVDGKKELVSIPESEKEVVLYFYKKITHQMILNN